MLVADMTPETPRPLARLSRPLQRCVQSVSVQRTHVQHRQSSLEPITTTTDTDSLLSGVASQSGLESPSKVALQSPSRSPVDRQDGELALTVAAPPALLPSSPLDSASAHNTLSPAPVPVRDLGSSKEERVDWSFLHPTHLLDAHYTTIVRRSFISCVLLAWVLDYAHRLAHDSSVLLMIYMGITLAAFVIGSAIFPEGEMPTSAMRYLHATNACIVAARLHSVQSKFHDFQMRHGSQPSHGARLEPPPLAVLSAPANGLWSSNGTRLLAESTPGDEPSLGVAPEVDRHAASAEVAAIRLAFLCASALGAVGRAALSSYGQGYYFWCAGRLLAVFNALVLLACVGLLWWYEAPPVYPPTDGSVAEPILLAGWLLLLAAGFGPRTRSRVARLVGLRHADLMGFAWTQPKARSKARQAGPAATRKGHKGRPPPPQHRTQQLRKLQSVPHPHPDAEPKPQ